MLADVYALAPERSAALVERFLDRFLPNRERADAEYTVRAGREEMVLGTPEEMAAFCEARADADGRAYWTSRSPGDPRCAHVFFLPDGGLVLGLSVGARKDAARDRWLADLMSFAGAEHGYWTVECPPEDTVAEFVRVSQAARMTHWT